MKRAAALFVLALAATDAAAQSVGSGATPLPVPFETAVAPETVTVGARFRVTVSARQAPGWRLELLPPADTGRVRMVARTPGARPDSAGIVRATATLVAWRTGAAGGVPALARLRAPDGSQRTLPLRLPLPAVRSVLPADPSRQVPRGPKDVWGPGQDWRAIAVLALLGALLLVLLLRLYVRRRRRRGSEGGTPRERALVLLRQAGDGGLVEAEDWRGFYTLVAGALRGYAAALDGRWSRDLTTSELLARMRGQGVSPSDVAEVAEVLRRADLAKFARRRFTPDEARRDLARAERWVEAFPPAEGAQPAPEEAAA